MSDFLWTLLKLDILGSLLAVLLILLRPALQKYAGRTVTYYLWLLVLIRLCVPAGITVSIPLPEAGTRNTESEIPAGLSPALLENHTAASQGHDTGTDAAKKEPYSRPKSDSSILTAGLNAAGFAAFLKLPAFWIVLWGIGASACLCRYLGSYLYFSRKIKNSAKKASPEASGMLQSLVPNRKIKLAVCPLVNTPMLLGILRPAVVLPAGIIGKEQLRDILTHELIHEKRKDLLYKWFTVLAACLHWFNPFMIVIRREISRACELACDEAVIRSMDICRRRHYGETLLALAGGPHSGPKHFTVTLCEEKALLKERLISIAAYQRRGTAAVIFTFVFILAAGGCALIADAEADKPDRPAAENAKTDDILEKILSGEEPFLYAAENMPDGSGTAAADRQVPFLYETDKTKAESKNISDVPKIFSPSSEYAAIENFIIIDLDGDGSMEAVLHIIDAAGDMGGFLILHQTEGRFYGYTSSYRTFWDLKTDGSFQYSRPDGSEDGICSIRFTPTGYSTVPIACTRTTDHWLSASYQIGSRTASQKEYEKETERQQKKPDAVWQEFISDEKKDAAEPESDPASDPHSFPVRVSDSRTLTITLSTVLLQETYFSIHKISVYDRETLIQTINTASLEPDENHAWDGLYLNQGYQTGEPDIRDLNFDGSQDFGLLSVSAYSRNVPYSYFLWNEAENRFDYSFTLFGNRALEIDTRNRSLIETVSETTGETKKVYYYAPDGSLQSGQPRI